MPACRMPPSTVPRLSKYLVNKACASAVCKNSGEVPCVRAVGSVSLTTFCHLRAGLSGWSYVAESKRSAGTELDSVTCIL